MKEVTTGGGGVGKGRAEGCGGMEGVYDRRGKAVRG